MTAEVAAQASNPSTREEAMGLLLAKPSLYFYTEFREEEMGRVEVEPESGGGRGVRAERGRLEAGT